MCLPHCDSMDCSMPDLPVLHNQLEPARTHVHWVSDAIQPSYPLSPLLLLPSIFPRISILSNALALHIRWPKHWTFSVSISLSNEYSGLISFRIDWFDPPAVQGRLKSLPNTQFKSINSSVLSLLYGPFLTSIHNYRKSHSFDYMGIFSKIMSLLFSMLSRFVIAFLPGSRPLLVSWLQSPSEVIFSPRK